MLKLNQATREWNMTKVENTLAKYITTAAEGAAYDVACKRLLANKIILAWIMKSCLEEYRECEVKEKT